MNIKLKYKLFIFFGCLIAFTAFSQFTFNKYYPSGNLSGANYVEETSPNNYLVFGHYKDTLTNQQGFEIYKLNNLGSITFKKKYQYTYEVASFYSSNHILRFSQNKLYITSGIYTASNNSVLFMSIDKNTLDTLWCKKLIDNYDYYMHQISRVAVNEIWLMGTRGSNSISMRPVIIKYDTLGNLLGIREYTILINYECYNIEYEPSTAKFYFAGNNFNTNPNTSYNITCMDTSGFIHWNHNVQSEKLFLKKIKVVNNELWCAGNKRVSNNFTSGEDKIVFYKYSITDGSLLLSKTYGGEYNGNLITSFTLLPNNEVMFCGTYGNLPYISGYNRNGLLLKTKTNGDSLWLRTFDNMSTVSYEMFLDVKSTTDGGYIACGTPIFAPNKLTQSWVVKTDVIGIAPTYTTVGFEDHNNNDTLSINGVNIYPNPFNESIYIQMKQSAILEIEVKNALGQIVLKQSTVDNQTKLDLNAQVPGIYFITLKNTHSQKTVKVLKR